MPAAVYAGSFDPPTNGHRWMIEQGSRLFDRLVVGVGTNALKRANYSVEERIACLEAVCSDLPNVTIEVFAGRYLVDFAVEQGAEFLLRGVRGVADWSYEQGMRNINHDLNPTLETVLLIPPRELCDISSSIVRGLVGQAGWRDVVPRYVPSAAWELIQSHHQHVGGE